VDRGLSHGHVARVSVQEEIDVVELSVGTGHIHAGEVSLGRQRGEILHVNSDEFQLECLALEGNDEIAVPELDLFSDMLLDSRLDFSGNNGGDVGLICLGGLWQGLPGTATNQDAQQRSNPWTDETTYHSRPLLHLLSHALISAVGRHLFYDSCLLRPSYGLGQSISVITKGRRGNNFTFCCWPFWFLARRERTGIS